MKETLQVLTAEEAHDFMVGFQACTPSEKKLILYFLENDLNFRGTFRDLLRDMGYHENYYSEVHKACHRLQNAGILEIYEPNVGYTRTIKMCKDWIETLIKIGKDQDKCSQNQSSPTPLINWEITR